MLQSAIIFLSVLGSKCLKYPPLFFKHNVNRLLKFCLISWSACWVTAHQALLTLSSIVSSLVVGAIWSRRLLHIPKNKNQEGWNQEILKTTVLSHRGWFWYLRVRNLQTIMMCRRTIILESHPLSNIFHVTRYQSR